jgi:peptidoglycan/LPS O-acetylase OafA/YrhL
MSTVIEAVEGSPTRRPARSLGRRPALDGLRGAAFVMVFIDHTQLLANLQFGEVAMYVFLALSGFLVTVALLGEAGRRRTIGVRRFFARRGRRLLPALVALLVVWLVVVGLFPHAGWTSTTPGGGATGPTDFGVAIRGSIGALGYLTNWLDILGLYGGRFPLGHLWFLATQEQLYLFWVPVLALLVSRCRRLVVPVALVLAAASTGWALLLMHQGSNWMRIYAGTDTRAASILLGSALAVGWTSGRFDALARRGWGTVARVSSVAVLVWALFTFSTRHASLDDALAWVAATVAGAFLVLAMVVAEAGWLHRLLGHRVLGYLGSRSYGLYLWHYVWLTWLSSFGLLGIAGALVASLVCAEASWQVIELRFGSGRRPDPSPPTPSSPAPARSHPAPPTRLETVVSAPIMGA